MSASTGLIRTKHDGQDGSGCPEIVHLSSGKKFPRRNAISPKTFGDIVADFPKVNNHS